jgi:hypothetical protein
LPQDRQAPGFAGLYIKGIDAGLFPVFKQSRRNHPGCVDPPFARTFGKAAADGCFSGPEISRQDQDPAAFHRAFSITTRV